MSGNSRHPLDLTGKVALVTGGNSGIGLATATSLADAGAAVAIWGRRRERNEAAADKLRTIGPAIHAASVDISAAEQVEAGFEHVVTTLGRVDRVFANAGNLIPGGPFLDITPDTRTGQLGTITLYAYQTGNRTT